MASSLERTGVGFCWKPLAAGEGAGQFVAVAQFVHNKPQTACETGCNCLMHKDLLHDVTTVPDVDNFRLARAFYVVDTFAGIRQARCHVNGLRHGGLCTEHVDKSVGNVVRPAWRQALVGIARGFGTPVMLT